MQQYFLEHEIKPLERVLLPDDVLYHLKKVLRKDGSYRFRVADPKGRIFSAHLMDDKNCMIDEEIKEWNELPYPVTALIAVIKNEKMEWIFQKLTELGVSRIVLFEAERSQYAPEGKNRYERYRRIIREAAEQCNRNLIPELTECIPFERIRDYRSEKNLLAYEKEDSNKRFCADASVSFVIGPEGGFTKKEAEELMDWGFTSVSLGKRILRAETAAIYVMSILAEGMR